MVAGVLVLASGVALAANIVGNNGPNLLIGTQQADNIAGAAGNDTINARGGNDRAFGDSGTDELNGGEGADFLNVVSFGTRGENDARWLHKGRRIGVQGRLHHSQWTDADGSPHERYECLAEQVTYLDSPRRNGAAVEPEATAS